MQVLETVKSSNQTEGRSRDKRGRRRHGENKTAGKEKRVMTAGKRIREEDWCTGGRRGVVGVNGG